MCQIPSSIDPYYVASGIVLLVTVIGLLFAVVVSIQDRRADERRHAVAGGRR